MNRLRREPTQWYGGMFWSYNEVAWCGFFGSMPTGQFLLRHELTWHHAVPEVAAVDILELRAERHMDRFSGIWAQPGIFAPEGDFGEYPAETFARAGVPLWCGARHRDAALSRLRSWLEPLPQRHGVIEPSLLVHPDCEHFIRTVPSLEADDQAPMLDDVIETSDMFPALGAAYFVMARPMRPELARAKYPPGAIGWDVDELRAESTRLR